MKPAAIFGLIALAGAAVAAAIWSTRSATTSATSGQLAAIDTTSAGTPAQNRLLPALSDKVNSVTEITITRPEFTFTVHRVGDTWRLKEKGDYPARPETVRQVVIGLADLRIIEAKTARPEMYSKLGVEDPIAPAADAGPNASTPQSTLVALKDAGGATLAEVIVGNRKPGATSATSSVFVRRKGEAQSWECAGSLEVPREQMAWLDTQFANLERTRVKSIRIAPIDSEAIEVSRTSPSDPFRLANLPAGKELKEPNTPENLAGALTFASFLDVSTASGIDFDDKAAKPRMFDLRTFDGLVISGSSVHKDAKTWWKLTATSDEAISREAASKAPDPSKPEENKPTQEQIDATVARIKKEVEELNRKWTGFAFAPQDFKASPLNAALAELVQDPSPPSTPPADAPGMPASPPSR